MSGALPLVLDWDGTVTERDTLHMVIEEFGDLEVFRSLEGDLDGRRTLNEVIAIEMSTITAPQEQVVDWLLEHVELRPGLPELLEAHDPLIVSAGFHDLIAPVLARERLAARVVAHRVDARPDGWRARFAERAACAVCGEPCKRVVTAALGDFAYVGDGVSDRCVSLAAVRVFARSGLATWLGGRGVPFERFAALPVVARALERA
jgi:2-hydroxy-3-keto-5-methylthiopentenyl-1-phosphate phosphatase